MTFAGEEPLLGTLKLTAEVDSAKKEEKNFTNLTYTRTSEEAYKGSNSVVLAREKGMISSQAMKVQKGGSFTYQLAYKAYEISTLSMVEDLDNGKKSGLLATIPLLSVGEIMTPNTENKTKILNFNVLGLLPLAKKLFTKPTKSFRIGKFSEKPQASISFRIYSDSTLSAVVWEKTVSLQEATQWQTAKDSLEIPENGYLVSVLKNENNKETLLDEFELRTYGTQKARIIQENHYEPFGMTLQGLDYVAEDTRGNKFLFNDGTERETSLDLYIDETDWRGYDMQSGRMTGVDALADEMHSFTSYHYAFNDPVSMNDPTGLAPPSFKEFLTQLFENSKSGAIYSGADVEKAYATVAKGGESTDLNVTQNKEGGIDLHRTWAGVENGVATAYSQKIGSIATSNHKSFGETGDYVMTPMTGFDRFMRFWEGSRREFNFREVNDDGTLSDRVAYQTMVGNPPDLAGGVKSLLSSIKSFGQIGLRNPKSVDILKKAMLDGSFDYASLKGKIGGYYHHGKYIISEGHHRIVAAKEILKETGNANPLIQLITNGRWTHQVHSYRPMPSRDLIGQFRNWLGF